MINWILKYPRTLGAITAGIAVLPLYIYTNSVWILAIYIGIISLIGLFIDRTKFVPVQNEQTIKEFLSKYLQQGSIKPRCYSIMIPIWLLGRGSTAKHMLISYYDNKYMINYGSEELAEVTRVSDIYLWANMLGVDLEKFKN